VKSFNWNSNFETGIQKVDEQHKTLVDIINEYSSLLANNATTSNDIEATLEKLLTYTKFHFEDEELLMDNIQLDSRHVQPHKKLHNDLVDEITSMVLDESSDKFSVRTHILDLVIYWLAYHILGTDMNMARQMSAIQSGLSPDAAYEQEEKEKDKSTEPLLDALNGLFSQVSARNKELQELNSSLEEKVELRTLQLMEANKHLEKLSLTDPLTNIPNRRYAMQQLTLLWDESEQTSKPIVCLMIDVDYFKSINDTYGHDIGDLFLIKFSETLKYSIRNDDIVCRLGGDEFFIICPDTDLKGGLHLAGMIKEKVSLLKIETKEKPIYGSISVGVAVKTKTMSNFEELIKIADKGVYLAKSSGRGCVRTIQ